MWAPIVVSVLCVSCQGLRHSLIDSCGTYDSGHYYREKFLEAS